MEILIVMIGFSAAAGSGLILLVCLAGRRAQLIRAFNMEQEREARARQVEENQAKQKEKQPSIAQPLPGG